MKKYIYKVPGGKLLKIFLEESSGKINRIKITGDFFVHPEENIEKLENHLLQTPFEKDAIKEKINDFLKNNPTNFFGLDIESLVFAILSVS